MTTPTLADRVSKRIQELYEKAHAEVEESQRYHPTTQVALACRAATEAVLEELTAMDERLKSLESSCQTGGASLRGPTFG